MKKIILAILLLAFCNFNLLGQSSVTKEEYEVYTTVFEKYFEYFNPNKSVINIAILQDTISSDLEKSLNDKHFSDYFYSMFLSAQLTRTDLEDLVENFVETNKNSVRLEKQIPTEYEYSLVTKAEIEALLEEGRKENVEYYKKCSPCAANSGCAHQYKLCRQDEKCSPCVVNPYTWQPFYKKYRNSRGYYSLSRVGFGKDKKYALVYINMDGEGRRDLRFYVLNKVNDKWEIYKSFGGGWIK